MEPALAGRPQDLQELLLLQQWPAPTGYAASLDVLARLAELYQCAVADLVIDLADYSDLDTARATSGNLSGLWLSPYSYFSSGRDANLHGEHTIRLHHTGSRLHGTNDPADGESRLTLDVSVSGAIATGTWKERTASTGYYRGAVYHGTIQLVVSPHARGMNGRWLGFGKNFIVNSGDWHLEWLETEPTYGTSPDPLINATIVVPRGNTPRATWSNSAYIIFASYTQSNRNPCRTSKSPMNASSSGVRLA
jgi:hypothetical protein